MGDTDGGALDFQVSVAKGNGVQALDDLFNLIPTDVLDESDALVLLANVSYEA